MKFILFSLRIVFFLFLVCFLVLTGVYLFAITRSLSNIGINQQIEVYDINNDCFLVLNNGQRTSKTELSEISDYVMKSAVAIEDKRFYSHSGFDYRRIGKSIIVNISSNSLSEGASTITQQLARNLYLSTEKTWTRKIMEAYYTIQIEANYEKDDILEAYLNTINFGHGVYGIANASYFYFEKAAKDLTLAESATLVAIVRSPTYYSPINDFTLNQERKDLILSLLLEQEMINDAEYNKAYNEEITIIGKNKIGPFDSSTFFQDIVINELTKLGVINNIDYPKLKIYTTLDPKIDKSITSAIDSTITDNLETAVVVMDPRTGYVLGISGGRDYNLSTYNRAINAKRQPGSAIKPFLYYTALENGLASDTTFYSMPTTFRLNGGETYSPTNFASIYPYQEITMAYAIAVSDNIYAIKTHLFLGENKMAETLKRVGIKDVEANVTLALGTNSLSPLELTTAYAHLANGGYKVSPVFIKKIVANEITLYENKLENKQLLNPDSVYILNKMMEGVFDINMNYYLAVTGSSIANKISHTYSAKSGSTDFDNWFVGYNPNYLITVWSGYDDNSPVENQNDRVVSKNIWLRVMEDTMANMPNITYTKPASITEKMLDPLTGKYNPHTYMKLFYFKRDDI